MHKYYYEAVLQLRNPSEEAVNQLERSLKGVLAKVEKVRGGFDFYVQDKKRAGNAAKSLVERLGGFLKVSRKLHTLDKQTSKPVYRLNYSVRLPSYRKGDFLAVGGEVLRVKQMGKKVKCVNILTGKSLLLTPEDREVLKVYHTRVVKVNPELEVLHPLTYQPVTVRNPKQLRLGEKVRVVIHKEVFLV